MKQPDFLVMNRSVAPGTSQWNRAKAAVQIRGRAVEIEVNPEKDDWVNQRAPRLRVLARGAWLDLQVPNLTEALGPYPGTWLPKHRRGEQEAALNAAIDFLVGYAAEWITRNEANL